MKRIMLIIILIIVGSNCFAAMKWLESIEIENHTQDDIFITYVLNQGASSQENNFFFDLRIQNFIFEGHDRLFNNPCSVISFFDLRKIVELNYISDMGKRVYNLEIPDGIPFLEKLRSIYSKLEITNAEGTVLFSLDDAENTLVKKFVFGNVNVYALVICDDNHYEEGNISEQEMKSVVENYPEYLVGVKKASEW